MSEEILAAAAREFEAFRDHIRSSVIPGLQSEMMSLSDAWDGAGSEAARDEASEIIDKHESNAVAAGEVARKLRSMEWSVVKTKIAANSNADQVQTDCEALATDTDLSPAAKQALIEGRVRAGLAENSQLVSTNTVELAGNISARLGIAGADGTMPDGAPVSELPSDSGFHDYEDEPAFPVGPTLAGASYGAGGRGQGAGGGPPALTPKTAPVAPPPTQHPSATAAPGTPSLGSPSSTGGGSSSVLSSSGGGTSSGSSVGSPPSSAGAGTGSGATSVGGQTSVSPAVAGADKATAATGRPNMSPALPPPLSAPAPAAQPAPSPNPAQPSAAAAGSPAPTAPSSAGAAGGGLGATAVTASGASAVGPSPMPLGPPTTPSPAAPNNPGTTPAAGPLGPGTAPVSAQASSVAGGPPAVPVSATRAARDAAVAASTAGALRRRTQGNDPAELARRIAAALNVGNFDYGFYWVTALTVEGTIAVANSYGIGYIPANVILPEGVQMVTADESIPAEARAGWATYPILALQGWARHRDEPLRVVIATEDQFRGFDPGASKVVLRNEDIPDDGTMLGRTRLEVIAPEAAAKLATTSDDDLANLLPPAQTDAQRPPSDLAMLWFEVAKPLMSSSTGRIEAHLEAFRSYADHAMALALHIAHTDPEMHAQRAAIADWVYWQHQSSLLAEAMGSAASGIAASS